MHTSLDELDTNLDEVLPLETVSSRLKFSKKEQQLRQAAKQVRLQAKNVKAVSKSTGVSAKEIREFLDQKSKESRDSAKASNTTMKEMFNARLSQAVAACHPVQPEGCQRMSVRDAERMFRVPKSTINRRIKDPMAGHRIFGRY